MKYENRKVPCKTCKKNKPRSKSFELGNAKKQLYYCCYSCFKLGVGI